VSLIVPARGQSLIAARDTLRRCTWRVLGLFALLPRLALLSILAVLGFSATAALAQQDDWQGVERIVAIADVHGDYDNYIKVLEQAGVIDRRGRWSGGRTHLVQIGDVPDRGPDTDRIIRHLMTLESEAEKKGGRVHALIGNHEAMNVAGDLRYVHPGEFEAVKSRRASALREGYFERVRDYVQTRHDGTVVDEAWREAWLEDHPLGFVEHRQLWHPTGEFGSWVTGHNTVLRINRTLFVHGGLSPSILGMTIREINEQVRRELKNEVVDGIVTAEDGPLWYRDLASNKETAETAAHVEALLKAYDADRIVLGHTPGFGTIVPRYDARVLAADAGIGSYYGSHLASLLIEDGQAYTVQQGERVKLPESDAERLAYLKAIDAIEPDVKNLRYLINVLESPPAEESTEDPQTR
jgi:hypothetical protein